MVSVDNPLVSILINNYNYEEFLQESIDSALAQTYPHIEVIVVDDGSTDNSREIIASYGDKIVAIYQKNQGQASAFNQGFAKSKGDIICFLDADDIFHPQKIAIVVQGFQGNTKGEWCFHPLRLFNQENKSDRVTYETIDLIPNQIQAQDVQAEVISGKLGTPFNFPIPPTSGMCFSRNLSQQLLPMPTSEGILLNDSYLKFAALGISPGITINQELAYQRIHDRNLFTTIKQSPDAGEKEKQTTSAIFISTAYWLKTNFPKLAKYADNLFAVGLALSWQLASKSNQCQTIIKDYYSKTPLNSLILILIKSCYKYMRSL